jgi:hypothetical protein
MKLRNAANSAWITLFQLDGEWSLIPFENGTAAAPSIYFKDSGTDTGIYSPGTDQVGISAGGTSRFEVSTTATTSTLPVVHPLGAVGTPSITFTGDLNTGIYSPAADTIAFVEGGVEAMRIDSSSRVGIGTIAPDSLLHCGTTSAADNVAIKVQNASATDSAASASIVFTQGANYAAGEIRSVRLGNYSATAANQDSALAFYTANDGANGERARIDSSGRLLVGTSTSPSSGFGQYARLVVQGQPADATGGGNFSIQRGEAAAGGNITSGEGIGNISWNDNAGNTFGLIGCEADANAGTNDYPGRLVFSTTADGASSPTERMRIRADGSIEMGKADSGDKLAVLNAASQGVISAYATNASYAATATYVNVSRAANTAYSFIKLISGDFADTEFHLRGDGNAFADGTWSGGGADYAEYFEWTDGNADEEDRRGISVVLDDDKIRPAVAGEDPIGVISGNPSVVGDAAWNKWSGKYLRDEFGTYIQEDYEVEDEDGNAVVQQRRKLNPAYDPDQEYVSREQRPEWDCVGLMGKLRIRKGQPTGSRWIKMRDISGSVEEWLVR